MSERIHRLTMTAFRGVPTEMTVDFGKAQSMAIFGDNGTGKSTIADALEWYLTGDIELLTHEGRQHAVRHIGGSEGGPTSVTIETSGSLGGAATLTEDRKAEILEVAGRETFLLRGRTLADFINMTKTEKWKALVEILGLDSVEALRQDLQRVRSDLRKEAKTAEEKLKSCGTALSSEKGGPSEDKLLADLEGICGRIAVKPPPSIDTVVDPAWIASLTRSGPPMKDADQHRALAVKLETFLTFEPEYGTVIDWNTVVSSERAEELSRLTLLQEADGYRAKTSLNGKCPLCKQAIEEKTFVDQLKQTLLSLQEASVEQEERVQKMTAVVRALTAVDAERRSFHTRAREIGLDVPEPPVSPHSTVASSIRDRSVIEADLLRTYASAIEQWDRKAKKSIVTEAAPSSSDSRESALVVLTQICEQIKAWRSAKQESDAANRARDLADKVYAAYQDHQRDHLADILARITDRVADVYGKLHPGEGLSRVSVEPWTAKGIELAIDFHGSRQRPPHGVLSESHLNSLAIALFLAMAETFNEKIRFLVLDDVINSFDLEHRGQLAHLLANEFSDWQLIVLTHDHQFYEQLTRLAPNWRKLELTSWSHEEGPRTTRYESGGMLGEARGRLVGEDTSGAAMKARRALEELLQEVCEAMEASLPFRRGANNDRRGISQLLGGLRHTLKNRSKPFYKSLDPLLTSLFADVQATLNVEAHASRGRASVTEVEAALNRIEELDRTWTCSSCETRIWHEGTPAASQCKCGTSRFPPANP